MTTEKKPTRRFNVFLREVWIQTYEVDATDKMEALQKVMNGEGVSLDGHLEFSHIPEGYAVQTTVDDVEEV